MTIPHSHLPRSRRPNTVGPPRSARRAPHVRRLAPAAMTGAGSKRTLSDRLAGMSFMRRGAERELRTEFAKRQRSASPPKAETNAYANAVDNEEQWVLPAPVVPAGGHVVPLVIRECGVTFDDGATFGRQSYGSFNPELERRNEAIGRGENPDAPEMPTAVPDEDQEMKPPPAAPKAETKAKVIETVVLISDDDDKEAKVEEDEVEVVKVNRSGKTTAGPIIAKKKKMGGRAVDESALRKKRRKQKGKRTN